jgi:hypothetical protein
MIKRTADLVNDKKLKELQIFVMNQKMVCVSFILKRDATPNVVLTPYISIPTVFI